jgi:hypothetical protein
MKRRGFRLSPPPPTPPLPSTSAQLVGTGSCLSQPPPPPTSTYARLCARLGSYPTFSPPEVPSAYCLTLYASGNWTLTSGAGVQGVLASGAAPGGGPFNASVPHAMQVTVVGSAISAAIGGVPVAAVHDGAWTTGQVALGGGWHPAAFTGFAVRP